jgi:Phosphoesterase family
MDAWVKTHTMSKYEGAAGTTVMGYYERSDLPFYYALADEFTLCDGYHCSVLGPTHPNRLMQMSGTIDPGGRAGGPVTDTNASPDALWSCTWPTMPEVLEDAGVSWKVYNPSNIGVTGKYASLAQYDTWNPALYNPTTNPEVMLVADTVLPYFSAFRSPISPLYVKAFLPTFPNDFASDVKSGALPSVSWICPPAGWDEHPSGSPARGMYFTSLVLDGIRPSRSCRRSSSRRAEPATRPTRTPSWGAPPPPYRHSSGCPSRAVAAHPPATTSRSLTRSARRSASPSTTRTRRHTVPVHGLASEARVPARGDAPAVRRSF